MKSILALLVLVSSLGALAGERYVCQQNDTVGEGLTLILTQIGESALSEGQPYRFELQLRAPGNVLVINEVAHVETEDVLFSFRVKGKNIRGMIYLDELDQAWLSIKGQHLDFTCEYDEI